MRCTARDFEKVERVLKHPDVYPHISDDGSLPVEEFSIRGMLENPAVIILMPTDDIVATFMPYNYVMYEVHINILEAARNASSIEAVARAVDYVYETTPCVKMVAWVPDLYDNVYRFCLLFGMGVEGVVPESYMKDGKLYSQKLMGGTLSNWNEHKRGSRWVKQ